LEDVPKSILSIPLLGFLAPLGWLTGAEIRLGEVDDAYLESLPQVAAEFNRMYPWLPSRGQVVATPARTASPWDPKRYCVLYSGGVDSTSTLIRNIAKRPSTLTVRGSPDLPLQDERYWTRVLEEAQPFLRGLGVASHVVETNALGMVNQEAVRRHFKTRLTTGWWEQLAFGLFYLSVAAPYTYHDQVGNLVIGSSNTVRDQVPWGSTPMTDEKVRWGGVHVIHDSYDLDRLDKIRQIVLPYAKGHGGAIPLRVCIGKRSALEECHELNCGECAKCMVVELSLTLSGADASRFGFDLSDAALSRLKQSLEQGRFGRAYDPSAWQFIKENARSPPPEILSNHPGLHEFLEWFGRWDERSKRDKRLIDRVAPPGSRRREMAKAGFGRMEKTD
jgi:hypothetical protein